MKTLLIFFLSTISLMAQQNDTISKTKTGFNLNIAQDLSLAILDDNHLNEAFTLDATIRGEFQFDQQTIFAEYEHADLGGGSYNRYIIGLGYIFEIYRFELQPMFGVGFIDRFQKTTNTFTVSGQLVYKLTDWFGVFGELEFTKRSDLKLNPLRENGKLGIKIYF